LYGERKMNILPLMRIHAKNAILWSLPVRFCVTLIRRKSVMRIITHSIISSVHHPDEEQKHFCMNIRYTIMKTAHFFAALIFISTSLAFGGCYTQLASSGAGYGYSGRVYHSPRPVYSDTVRAKPTAVKYDTTMHGDTMFIDEHPVTAEAENNTSGGDGDEEVINNYYGPDSYWSGFSIGFGWPYHSWYSPWYPYYSSWDYGWGYPGFYPPYYDAFYGYGFYPYYNYGFYGGFYGHHYHGYGDGYRYGYGYGRTAIAGRLGGEYRAGSITSRVGMPGMIAPANTNGFRGSNAVASNGMASNVNIARAGEGSAIDRNAPVHVTAPDAGNAMVRTQSSGMNQSRATMSEQSNGMSNASTRPIVVRRSDGQSITSSSANVGGRQMTIVRRSASGGNYSGYARNGSASYGGGRGYGGSGRGYGGGYSTGRASSGGAVRSSGGGGGARSGGSSSGGRAGGEGGGRR
jgi:hypothetical protein